ncbi:hypothetical protein HAX54_052928 [Datura stramonium]|uniref:Uncharacterized protein n=1 Tax=Datura stramonium TaxID=4076 RepID=A0ABS8T0A3_DATST|nr:hypothetical protein [Datura stramonium]
MQKQPKRPGLKQQYYQMAHCRSMVISITLIVLLVCYPSSFEARKLLNKFSTEHKKKLIGPSREAIASSVLLNSSPSKNGYAKLAGVNVDRSVPSPGIGN